MTPPAAPPRRSSPSIKRQPSAPASEEDILNAILMSHLRARRNGATPQQTPTIPPLLARAHQQVSSIWAESTWATRAALWSRLQQFSAENNITAWPLGVRAVAFISNQTQLNPTTAYNYSRTIAALAHCFGKPVPLLELYSSAVRAAGAGTPIKQAVPLTRPLVRTLILRALESNDHRLATAMYLAWKTASRWNDVLNLTKESLIHFERSATESTVVIEWGPTKANRQRQFRVDGWTVVVELMNHEAIDMTRRVFDSLQPGERLTTVSTENLRNYMKRFQDTAQFTAHSFKRGAIDVLVTCASMGLLDVRLIPIMAKHKDDLHSFPATTLRYAPNKVHLAKMLGTQSATRLL